MAKQKRNRKKSGKTYSTGSLKGFILLVAIIAAALFFYQSQDKFPSKQKEVTQQLTEKLEDIQKEASQVGKHLSTKVEEIKTTAERTHHTSTATTAETRPSSISSKLEIPVVLQQREEIKLTRTGYTLSYNPHYKTPNWVAWELTRQETQGTGNRKDRFVPDPDLPEPRVVHADYTRSGYDRGHMAPAADMKWSEKAMLESFYMSNICPQNQKLNRDDWGDLEDLCRRWAKKYGTVHIACGPIYDSPTPKRIGKHQIAVPDRFYKVVLIYNRKNPIAMGFLFDNKAHHQTIAKYMVPVDSVEKETGMDFFSKLPDEIENRIEAIVPSLPSY